MEKTKQSTTWPVIIHQGMSQGDLAMILKQKQLKLRFSESIVPGSVIFPLSGVAFMVVPLAVATRTDPDTNSVQVTQELTERLERFSNVHRKCYVLCMSPLHGDNERQMLALIQRQCVDNQVGILPVHNTNEAVKTMLTIAQALCKPTSEIVSQRLQTVVQEQMAAGYMAAALKQLELSEHEIQVIEDGLGSLHKLATATEEELFNCSLNTSTVNKITAVFTNH